MVVRAQYRGLKIRRKHIEQCQEKLPIERRKKQIGYALVAAIRKLVEEWPDESDPIETTKSLGEGLYDRVLAAAPPAPPVFNPAQSEMAAAHVVPTPPPIRALPPLPVDSPEEIAAALIALNSMVVRLEQFTIQDLRAACCSPLNAQRLRNMAMHAQNGLSYFEQLLGAATP